MLDAAVGALIVVVATSALVLAIEVSEKAFNSAGQQPLSPAELEMLQSAGRSDSASLSQLKSDLEALPRDW
tara:strand:+ start:3217 stop:3429 length:213 start_codon:yes stop_codon:yes gene_type:complete